MEYVIIASMPIEKSFLKNISPSSFVIAVDAGWQQAKIANINPNLIVGDFDSAPLPKDMHNVKRLPCKKDETDSYYAAKWAVENGAEKVTILGGLGGRADHSFANIQTLLFLAKNRVENELIDSQNKISCWWPQKKRLTKNENSYFSLFAINGMAKKLNITNAKYELNDFDLRQDFPLGISNEFTEKDAIIEWQEGYLLAMVCKKESEQTVK